MFDSGLSSLSGVSILVTSVLSNFLQDACEAVDSAQLLEAANSEISLHVSSLATYLRSNPLTRAVIVPPLPRLTPEWFNAYLPCFTTFLVSEVSKFSSGQIRVLAPFVALPSSFESDGVHLNAASGISFIQYVLNGIDQLLPVLDAFDVASSQNHSQAFVSAPASFPKHSGFGSAVGEVTGSAGSSPLLHQAVSSLTSLTGSMRAEITARRLQDNLIFARLREDQDYALNKNREDRFTVSGLQVTIPPPQNPLERKEFFKEILSSLVLKACPDLDPQPKILDVYVNMRYGRGPPFIEARLDSASASAAFRVAAAKLSKGEDPDPDFSGLFVANSVTLTTRVRIEVLRALAKVLSTTSEDAFVQSFSSRPMLHYQAREGAMFPAPGTNRSYSYVEAVGRWGDRLSTPDLIPAYRRARPAFIGCLEQYFVVLKESEPRDETPSGFDQLFASGSNVFRGHGNRGQGFRGQGFRGQGYRSSRRSHVRGGRSSHVRAGVPSTSQSVGQGFGGRKRLASNEVQASPSKRKENRDEGAINQDLNITDQHEST